MNEGNGSVVGAEIAPVTSGCVPCNKSSRLNDRLL